MNIPIVWAIIKKDARSLSWLVGLIALLFLADALITRLDLLPVWTDYSAPVILFALIVLLVPIFQLDSPASLEDDWLCRPIPKPELLAAKFLLAVGVVYLPRALGTFVADLALGFPLLEAIPDAVLLQDKLSLFTLPTILFAAIVTRTFVQALGTLFAIYIGVFAIPTPFVRPPGPLTPGLREELLVSGMQWLATTPAQLASIALLALGFWLVYWRRRLLAARLLLAATVLVTLGLVVLPMALSNWIAAHAIQAAVSPEPPADVASITLRNTKVCFAAVQRAEMSSDAQFGSWEEEALQDAGTNAVAFVTAIEARRLPVDWRAMLHYVQADYIVGNDSLYSLRPARYTPRNGGGDLLTHAWMLPESSLQRLRGAAAQLQLTYFMTLVKPREYRLPTDGSRHRLPNLGYCSARVAETDNRIDVDCFMAGARPVQISAQLNDIRASGAFSRPDFSPPPTQWVYGDRVKLEIGSPRLARHDTITIVAWDAAGQIRKSLTLPGILGADTDTCPLPGTGPKRFQASSWRDSTPHQVLSIGVDDGVQLEVLDFGGEGSPILLLPGLGATAHSFDDLAPQLASAHRVVALTRRGGGASSKPDFGYETPRLAQDVLRVMDAMKLGKVLLVGHSIAGDELTWLGGHHADRFRGLVYLDAAYDRSKDSSRNPGLRGLYAKLPPEPPLPLSAYASYEAMTTMLEQRGHLRVPEGELIALWQANNPALAGTPSIDARAQQAIAAAIEAPDYAAVKMPALAIYAMRDPGKPLPTWYDASDASLMTTIAELHRSMDAKKQRDIETFRRGVEHGRVIELPNAEHYVVQSNPKEILDAVEEFAATLPP